MISTFKKLAPNQGFTLTHIDGVKLMRWNHSVPRSPVYYDPCIVIVCQGRKRGYLGQEVFHYNAKQFLVLSIPLPFESETIASAEEPLLAISVQLNLSVITELVLAMGDEEPLLDEAPQSIVSTPMDDEMTDAAARLLKVLSTNKDMQVLGKSIVREIHYRALTSEQGSKIRAMLNFQNHASKISKALKLIHSDYSTEMNVNKLAEVSGMSVAAFHANFKAVTSKSPIQYLKSTRLHKARVLMIQEGGTAAWASAEVGYESSSQFSREYKRHFGRSPKEDVNLMKHSLALNSFVE